MDRLAPVSFEVLGAPVGRCVFLNAFFLVTPIVERLCIYLSCFVLHLQSYKVCFVSDFVPNTSDDERRYSYKNQPHVALFNLEKLRVALASLLDPVE